MDPNLNFLSEIIITNWYCGKISAYGAFGNECTFDKKSDIGKVRRIAQKNGYKVHFQNGILRSLIKI